MRVVELVFAVVWAMFWAYWLLAAFSMKRGRVPWSRELGIRVLVAVIVVLLYRLGAFRHSSLNTAVSRAAVGLALLAIGLGSRHPIYSGILLATVGTAIGLDWTSLIAVLLAAIYFIYSAIVEEHYLAEHFPGTYPAYKRSTKMLVPYLFQMAAPAPAWRFRKSEAL
jgi:protein-S-isoprenylcysteine O-methyltransferase Ste14